MSTQKLYPEGLLGKKIGMTQVFTEEGKTIPVTAVELGPCYVLAVRESDKDGYSAVQFGFEPKKMQRANKAEKGHLSKAGKGAFYHVKEIRCDTEALGWNDLGKEVRVGDLFADGEMVDVSGCSKGRGFSGVVRRFGVAGQPASRGTHEAFRNIGSVGSGTYPGRIWKNLKMPGQMGNKKVTVQNLRVMGVRPEENVILIKGAVPGPKGGLVVVKKAMKHYEPQKAA